MSIINSAYYRQYISVYLILVQNIIIAFNLQVRLVLATTTINAPQICHTYIFFSPFLLLQYYFQKKHSSVLNNVKQQ